MNLPFNPNAEENRQVILEALRPYLTGRVLEAGSGTGQHAVYFCRELPELQWQTSELAENLPGIRAWIDDSGLDNLLPPIEMDIRGAWPDETYDTVYSANCLHIVDAATAASFIEGAARCLREGGCLAVYGPFNYDGQFTSDSNARFDAMLKSSGMGAGIKDFEWLDRLARAGGMALEADIAMPANNRSLVWKKTNF